MTESTERAAFEAAYARLYPVSSLTPGKFAREHGCYEDTTVMVGWTMWQAARASLLEGKAEPAWQTIETAPKDGTRVILAWGGKSINGFYLDNSHTATPWAGWRVESMVVQPPGKPTHWMPLPSPPSMDGAVQAATSGGER